MATVIGATVADDIRSHLERVEHLLAAIAVRLGIDVDDLPPPWEPAP
jgi:hypothetical protein